MSPTSSSRRLRPVSSLGLCAAAAAVLVPLSSASVAWSGRQASDYSFGGRACFDVRRDRGAARSGPGLGRRRGDCRRGIHVRPQRRGDAGVRGRHAEPDHRARGRNPAPRRPGSVRLPARSQRLLVRLALLVVKQSWALSVDEPEARALRRVYGGRAPERFARLSCFDSDIEQDREDAARGRR